MTGILGVAEWFPVKVFILLTLCRPQLLIKTSTSTPTRPLHACSYTVQWSSDESFGSGSGEAKVSAPYDYGLDPDSWMTYTIDGVTADEPTYVRVMASNAVGFSEPVAAMPHGWSQHEVSRARSRVLIHGCLLRPNTVSGTCVGIG